MMVPSMESVSKTQEFAFQAEIKQLLHLLAHSLYQGKEIAVRELISNASDALDKMRYVSLTEESERDSAPLEIVLEGRKDQAELVVRDNGVGMTHDELVTNLGTIAHSGSLEFLKAAAPGQGDKSALSLIGRFGVGFYASFMIADRVRVRSRGYKETQGWEWESDGAGTYRISPAEGLPRGTEVILHLKDDCKEFADDWKLKTIIRRYSGYVPHPVKVEGEVVNSQKPIWVEPKSQVSDEQYRQFYQYLTHRDDESPLWHLHLAGDSPIQFRAVLYCPPNNLELLGLGLQQHGLSLCAKRVLVQSDCRELLPEYLRFLHGLVDSEDLPLNVSRETLQDNSVIRRIRNTLVKGVLDKLDKLAAESPADYLTFYRQFGQVFKEGVGRDAMNRDRVAKLLRFTSTHALDPEAPASLDDYVKRSPADQKVIYYLGGPDFAALRKNPNLEIFRRRGFEVLFLTEPVDEFVMSYLGAYDGRRLVSIDASDLDLPPEAGAAEKGPEEESGTKEETPSSSALARVLTLFREALADRVKDVRESKRLTDSPCCLVNSEGSLSTQMQRILKLADKNFQATARVLEINPSAPLIRRLASLAANPDHEGFIKQCALQLWANSLLLEGTLPEPEATVQRNQSFMEEAAEKRSPIVF
jgi:molecular chaperone HtpG